MLLVPSFVQLLQQTFGSVMTKPTFASFLTIASGWMMAPRRTVTGALLSSAAARPKHHSAYHRVFAAARWSMDAAGLAVLRLVLVTVASAAASGEVFLVVDDTLCHKCGHRMFGLGMHYDAALTSRRSSNAHQSIKSKGHCWVVLGVVVSFPWRPGHYYCLPVLFRLYLNNKAAARHRVAYRTRPELAVQMLRLLCQDAYPDRRFHLLVDSGYGGQNVLRALPDNCQMTARWLTNARLHEPAPLRSPGTNGRPRVRGARLPSPLQMLDDSRTERLELNIYGHRRDRCRVADCLACLYTVPQRLLRVVAVEPLSAGGRPRPSMRQAFFSTDTTASAQQVLTWYAMRWSIEVAFHDAKQQLGFEQPQGWTRLAVLRSAPTLMLLYDLIVLWFAAEGHRCCQLPLRPWYKSKPAASFADMLTTLRCRSVETLLQPPGTEPSRQNPLPLLIAALRAAA